MNRSFLTLLILEIILFVACSNSDDFAGVTTEPNDSALETPNDVTETYLLSSSAGTFGGTTEEAGLSSVSMTLPSSSSAAVVPDVMLETRRAVLDSVLSSLEGNKGFAQSNDSTPSPTTSSSKTAYDFKTKGESFLDDAQCYIRLYEYENGVQMIGGLHGFLMQTTLVFDGAKVVLRMVNNNYWGGDIVTDCRADSISFRKNCESQSGVFRNYRTGSGCESIGGVLQLACAIPMPEKATVSELLTDEAEMYKQNCKSEPVKEPDCTIVCEMNEAGESCQMSCL